jgi:hypothetical protein
MNVIKALWVVEFQTNAGHWEIAHGIEGEWAIFTDCREAHVFQKLHESDGRTMRTRVFTPEGDE